MKPTKNKVFCRNCERVKMLFETQKKADNFIKFNREEIESKSGYSPERSYYCMFCDGWHLTSIKEKIGASNNEIRFDNYIKEKTVKKDSPAKEQSNKIMTNLEDKIKEMNAYEKEVFISENIILHNKEIETLDIKDSDYKLKLKELRKKVECLYVLRKRNGFTKAKTKIEESREREFEEYRLWVEKTKN